MLSVVIPTFNRLSILQEVLENLAQATVPATGFEVIVVSDGSTDGTNEWLAHWRPPHPFRFVLQENSGPGRARNRAAGIAKGERILFMGDDTVPSRELLVLHAQRAGREPDPEKIAVLGYTSWHPRMKVSPFLNHINEYGLQFGFSIIPDPGDVPFNFFYTSNVSVGRDLFEKLGGFDTDFPGAAWEDVEFAYRASRSGMRMVYEPSARTAHFHPTSIRSFLGRQERAGESGAIFAAKHPELTDWLGVSSIPSAGGRLSRRARNGLLRIGDWIPFFFSPGLCDGVMRDAYLDGLSRALKGAGNSKGHFPRSSR